MAQPEQLFTNTNDYLDQISLSPTIEKPVQSDNLNEPQHTVIENSPNCLSRQPENQSMWKEFFSGMRMLQKYFVHTKADMSSIARANIRLLNNNLQTTSRYRHILASATQLRDEQSMLTQWPLITDEKLHGSIMSLRKSRTNGIDDNLASHICYDYFGTDGRINTPEPVFSLYLVLAGKLSVSQNGNIKSREASGIFSTDKRAKPVRKEMYKTGDVLMNPQSMGDISSIYACSKNTLLFGVHLSFDEVH